MEQWADKSNPFDLGEFEIDPRRRSVKGPNGETMIEPKVMAVLLMLCEHRGEVVTREQFLDAVWSREYGGDESLTRAISQLRKIFGDVKGVHTHIETVPKTGYRLVNKSEHPESTPVRSKRKGMFVLVLVALAIVIAMLAQLVPSDEEVVDSTASIGKATITIAVLPFDIQTASDEDQSLAFGVSDEILSALSRSPSLSVIARNSSFQFQGESKKDLAALGKQLNISHVVDGNLRRAEEGLRVGVHLIEANSGKVVWSDVVSRPETEIYSIPPEVASAVQTALGVDPAENRRQSYMPDPEAYQLYLHAKSLLSFRITANMDAAIGMLESAVGLDPVLVEAWETLAMTRIEYLFGQGPGENGSPNRDPFQRHRAARQDANAALAIDPDSIQARLALVILDNIEQRATLAETIGRMRSLLARAPNHPDVNRRLGMLTGGVGRFEEAAHYLGRARALDPLTFLNSALYSDVLLSGGRTEEAMSIVRAQGAYEYWQSYYTGLIMNLLWGEFESARRAFTNLGPSHVFFGDGVHQLPSVNVESDNTRYMSSLMARLIDIAEQGDTAVDPQLPEDLILAADEGLISYFYTAQLLAAAGFNDTALELVDERYTANDHMVRESGILLRPAFRAARQDASIMQWLDRTGLVDYWVETDEWPDFCADPALTWDCKLVAQAYSG